MAKPESVMRGIVLKALRSQGFRAMAVENEDCCPGTPDVHYIEKPPAYMRVGLEGWIELKKLDKWPIKPETIVSLPLFTIQQRMWLRDHVQVGGRAYLLLRVGGTRIADWLLFQGDMACAKVGRVTQDELRRIADWQWRGTMDAAQLATGLGRSCITPVV